MRKSIGGCGSATEWRSPGCNFSRTAKNTRLTSAPHPYGSWWAEVQARPLYGRKCSGERRWSPRLVESQS
jgi:hypothetical protein